MGVGKSSAPSAPTAEYTPLYVADSAAGNLASNIAQNQLAYEQQQVAGLQPYTSEMMGGAQDIAQQGEADSQYALGASNIAQGAGQSALGTFTGSTLPLAQQYSTQAANYNSPAQADLNAGLAVSDVGNAATAANANTTQQLEGYGIDPSQTRFQALDLGANISTAAQEAGAATTSRVNTQQTGLGLENSAIGLGSTIGGLGTSALNTTLGGYNSATSALSGASGAASTGVNEGLNQISTGASAIGTAPTYLGLAAQDYTGSANIINQAYSNEAQTAQINNQANSNFISGLGSLVGGAVGLGATGGLSGVGSALGGVVNGAFGGGVEGGSWNG
jgi:hypothetical protein